MLMSDVQHRMLRRSGPCIYKIHDRSLMLAYYSRVWLSNEIFHCRRVPVITARHAAAIIQALLHDSPLALGGDDETVQVNLEAVSDRVVVDARGQTAGADQRFRCRCRVRARVEPDRASAPPSPT